MADHNKSYEATHDPQPLAALNVQCY